MNGYITGKNRECRSSSLVSLVATDLSNYEVLGTLTSGSQMLLNLLYK